MASSTSSSHHVTRPLDPLAAAIVVVLCLSWGVNQVATKLAIHDIPLPFSRMRTRVGNCEWSAELGGPTTAQFAGFLQVVWYIVTMPENRSG